MCTAVDGCAIVKFRGSFFDCSVRRRTTGGYFFMAGHSGIGQTVPPYVVSKSKCTRMAQLTHCAFNEICNAPSKTESFFFFFFKILFSFCLFLPLTAPHHITIHLSLGVETTKLVCSVCNGQQTHSGNNSLCAAPTLCSATVSQLRIAATSSGWLCVLCERVCVLYSKWIGIR